MKIPVLKIKDANGNLIPINAIRGEAGANGKSAYEQAKDGGYKGTEAEFIAILNGLTNTGDAEHYSDFNNPHKVTAEQTGALPIQYPTSTDLNTEITMGGNRSAIHCYYEQTLNTPYKEGETDCTHGMVITNAHSPQYATQMCMPSGSSAIYTRTLNGQGISKWVRVANTNDLRNYTLYGEYDEFKQTVIQSFTNTENRVTALEGTATKIATGTYEGTGKAGVSNKNSLTFPFVPKIVFISTKEAVGSSKYFATATLVNKSSIGFATNSTPDAERAYQVPLSLFWDDEYKKLDWNAPNPSSLADSTASANQLNYSGMTYYWVAIG